MPSANLLALFDDVASMMDDVAVMTKKASSKTIGLMGDDLAVNSEQMVGLKPQDELTVVTKIFWGALINKAILIPVVLVLTYYFPLVLAGTLLLGGLYLSYEGFDKIEEKLISKFLKKEANESVGGKAPSLPIVQRIKGAVKTDFILSAEILAIAASTMTGEALLPMILSLTILSVAVNFIIYGSVLIIIKLDDLGLLVLSKNYNFLLNSIGKGLVSSSPYIMKGLGIIGTVATLLVGGGIFQHTFHLTMGLNAVLENLLFGLGVGFIVWSLVMLILKIKNRFI